MFGKACKLKTWTRFPFVRLLLPLIAGIICYGFFPRHQQTVFLPGILITTVFMLFLFLSSRLRSYKFRWIYGLVLNLFLVWIGFTLSEQHDQRNHASHFSAFLKDQQVVYVAELSDEPAERTNSFRLPLEVRYVFFKGKIYPVHGKILAYTGKEAASAIPGYGSYILFRETPGIISGPANPGEFDYARYLAGKNVFYQVYLKKGQFTVSGLKGGSLLKHFALHVRKGLLKTMKQYGITGQEYAVAAALLIGYDDLLDPAQRQAYAGAGVIHILCVSGLHVGIVFLIADSLLIFLRRRKHGIWLRPLLILLSIWAYALITGMAPSVMRASLMFSLITIGKSLNRHSHTYNTLAASAFILLVLNPALLFETGFQLSYLAVAGIVTFQPLFAKVFSPVSRPASYLWGLITVSLAAQLVTAPLSVYYFHQFPNYFLLANLLAIPMSGVLIYSGVLFAVVSVVPLFGKLSAAILVLQVRFLNGLVAFVENLPGAVTRDIYLSPASLVVIYVLILSFLLWVSNRNKTWIYLMLVSCILLALNYSVRSVKRDQQRLLVVQHINRHSAVSFTSGRKQVVLADSVVVANPELLNYAMANQRIRSGITSVCYIVPCNGNRSPEGPFPDFFEKDGFFSFCGKRGVVLSDNFCIPEQDRRIHLDYVIITGNLKQKLSALQGCFPGAEFIADASSPAWKCAAWKKEALQLGVPFYSVRESGAWVKQFPIDGLSIQF